MAKPRTTGLYCTKCGARYARCPAGMVTCASCGALGLRFYSRVPRRVKCGACDFQGWHDGGVNDDMGQHYQRAHTKDAEEVASLKRRLALAVRLLEPFAMESRLRPEGSYLAKDADFDAAAMFVATETGPAPEEGK